MQCAPRPAPPDRSVAASSPWPGRQARAGRRRLPCRTGPPLQARGPCLGYTVKHPPEADPRSAWGSRLDSLHLPADEETPVTAGESQRALHGRPSSLAESNRKGPQGCSPPDASPHAGFTEVNQTHRGVAWSNQALLRVSR